MIKAMRSSSNESDRLLYNDVRPWLLKLEAMSAEAIALLEGSHRFVIDYNNNPDFQFETLGGMGEEISLRVLTAEPSNKCLMPLLNEMLKRIHTVKSE